jgi:hypothetical protein
VDTALAADPAWPPVLVEAAELAEVRGDAATARDLLWRIGESLLPTQTRLARHFADPSTRSGAGRNRLRVRVRAQGVQVEERLCTAGLQRGDVVLTRLLDGGEGPVLGARLLVPLEQGDDLLAALREGSVAALLAWRRSSA